MDKIEAELSLGESSCAAQMSLERRMLSRHETTIIVKDPTAAGQDFKRGDLNKDGFFFLPEIDLVEGKELELEVRLPGLGEWIECSSVVRGLAVRGTAHGVVGRITEITGQAKGALDVWQRLAEDRTQKIGSATDRAEQRPS